MKPETKVGLLFLGAAALVVAFAWVLGVLNPFSNAYNLNVLYNYAGGIEVGSPVRVMGIKVGKVTRIQFDPHMKDAKGEETKLVISINVDKAAWDTIRADSQFYINLAGIIGEKFLEISPGQTSSAVLTPNQFVRGEDPPRVDQLISQSYGLAGKVINLIQKNEGSISDTIRLLDQLVTNVNKTLVLLDKTTRQADVVKLINNLNKITDDVSHVTQRFGTPEADKTLDLMHTLVWRLQDMDKDAIKKFLQDEGIRAHLF